MNKRKYLVYKITNRFNNKIYIGVHSTLNESDRYMGSGVEIREALKKEGKKSFVKEILFTFDTKEEMLAKEKELVTKEFCIREDTYNRIEGCGTYNNIDMIVVKDSQGNISKVYKEDPRWLSGELVGHTKYSESKTKGFASFKDEKNNYYYLSINDPRFLSGELVGLQKGCKGNIGFTNKEHSEETKIRMSEKAKQRIGEKNSQFGTCWITKENINKKIKKENLDEYINQGWIKGRLKLKQMIH